MTLPTDGRLARVVEISPREFSIFVGGKDVLEHSNRWLFEDEANPIVENINAAAEAWAQKKVDDALERAAKKCDDAGCPECCRDILDMKSKGAS
jgi:hypothetical protein